MSAEQRNTSTSENQESLRILSSILFEQRKVRLFDYKDRWFHRRLLSRLRSTQSEDVGEYLDYLKSHPAEIDRLLDALAINISSFFRNPEVFEAIEHRVFGAWASERRRLRYSAWSCACAQGEEPYSLAMLWEDWRMRQSDFSSAQLAITASDIDRDALDAASAGAYKAEKRKEVPEPFRERFLDARGEAEFVVKGELRARVKFVHENVLMAAGRQKFDLILCRNLMIFLDAGQQARIVGVFSDSLRPGGFLVLGKVEAIFHPQKEGFRVVDSVSRIYVKEPDEMSMPAKKRE
jgi:chemotaxis methyl-accepting protein methylase